MGKSPVLWRRWILSMRNHLETVHVNFVVNNGSSSTLKLNEISCFVNVFTKQNDGSTVTVNHNTNS